jgi:transcription initiation factor IIE alpha subunit
MQKVIDIPFSVGDEVWIAKMKQTKTAYPCPACKGSGKLYNTDGEQFSCSACRGIMKKYKTENVWYSVKKRVESISLFLYRDEIEIDTIFFDKDVGIDKETGSYTGDCTSIMEHIFTSEDLCNAYCVEQNNIHEWEYS